MNLPTNVLLLLLCFTHTMIRMESKRKEGRRDDFEFFKQKKNVDPTLETSSHT